MRGEERERGEEEGDPRPPPGPPPPAPRGGCVALLPHSLLLEEPVLWLRGALLHEQPEGPEPLPFEDQPDRVHLRTRVFVRPPIELGLEPLLPFPWLAEILRSHVSHGGSSPLFLCLLMRRSQKTRPPRGTRESHRVIL